MAKPERIERMLAVRIRPDLYADLERAAERNKASLSDEVRRRLSESLEREHAAPAAPTGWTGELTASITALAGKVEQAFGDWTTDPFAYETFTEGLKVIIQIMCTRPPGEAVPHPKSGVAGALFGSNPSPKDAGTMLGGMVVKW